MNRRYFLFSLAGGVLVTPAVDTTSIFAAESSSLSPRDKAALKSITTGVAAATSLTLYEGLPHQSSEAAQLKQELATKETVQRHNFPFYARPLPVDPADLPALRRLSSSPDSFRPYLGEKRCGGFHPDYCLTWKKEKSEYDLLVCFGCQEVHLYGPSDDVLLELGPAADELQKVLEKYHGQRPPKLLPKADR